VGSRLFRALTKRMKRGIYAFSEWQLATVARALQAAPNSHVRFGVRARIHFAVKGSLLRSIHCSLYIFWHGTDTCGGTATRDGPGQSWSAGGCVMGLVYRSSSRSHRRFHRHRQTGCGRLGARSWRGRGEKLAGSWPASMKNQLLQEDFRCRNIFANNKERLQMF